jgi:hypothetical protein
MLVIANNKDIDHRSLILSDAEIQYYPDKRNEYY